MENNVLVSEGHAVQEAAPFTARQNQSTDQQESSPEMRKVSGSECVLCAARMTCVLSREVTGLTYLGILLVTTPVRLCILHKMCGNSL